jgi:hypothetical protein
MRISRPPAFWVGSRGGAIYDNMRTTVDKIGIGKARQVNLDFGVW